MRDAILSVHCPKFDSAGVLPSIGRHCTPDSGFQVRWNANTLGDVMSTTGSSRNGVDRRGRQMGKEVELAAEEEASSTREDDSIVWAKALEYGARIKMQLNRHRS